MKKRFVQVIIRSFIAFLLAQLCFGSSLFAKGDRDVILVLDTSLSMLGYGGKNIFDRVKMSIADYIDNQLEEGDKVTFITFDTDVRVYPTVFVDDENDRDILKKYISMTEATGKWTHTYKMMDRVYDKAEEFDTKEDGRQTMVVVMTDAIDDPPPYDQKRFSIKNIAKKYGEKDWWVYLISFSEMKKNEELRKKFSELSKNVKIIDATSPEQGIGTDLTQDVKRREAQQRSTIPIIIIAVVVILLVIVILYLIKRYSELKVAGLLEYWNNDILEPYIEKIDLARRPVREAGIGKGVGCILHIRDINIKKPFLIKAVRVNGEIKMQVIGNESAAVEMVNRDSGDVLNDGDIFKVGNYTFRYNAP